MIKPPCFRDPGCESKVHVNVWSRNHKSIFEAIRILSDVLSYLELQLMWLFVGALRAILHIGTVLRREEPFHRVGFCRDLEEVDLRLDDVSAHGTNDSVDTFVCFLDVFLIVYISCDDLDIL
ncbi:hypothetical protein HG531_006583 [Fusarium graminearum]|nr:hypothetical protein HG531_006583 [Fusarium graminearum]